MDFPLLWLPEGPMVKLMIKPINHPKLWTIPWYTWYLGQPWLVCVCFLFAMEILASYMVICMVSRMDPDFSRGPSIFWGVENVDPRAKFQRIQAEAVGRTNRHGSHGPCRFDMVRWFTSANCRCSWLVPSYVKETDGASTIHTFIHVVEMDK